jgi:cellulose synthase/poly-beta-1,6-N-acetylglucosamine synthase-like glycosyltransferase
MEAAFWFAVTFIMYSYAGYPLCLVVLSFWRRRTVKKENITPTVSLVVTVHNEENRIRDKIENSMGLDYPRDRIEVVIASDCSTDDTDAIVTNYEPLGVRLIKASERSGKEATQKLAVQATSGEILVFSDVGTRLEPGAVRTIVKNFADPTVGCVSSMDRIVDAEGNVSGEGAYVQYEMLLRHLETGVSTLVSLSGSFFAARREVCQNWHANLQSDFNVLLNAVRLGLRGVSDLDSIGYYKTIADTSKEYERKVRTVLRGISVFMKSLPMLNPFRYGLFSWQLFSHKLCRWLVPLALVVVFVINVCLLSRSWWYRFFFILQLCFYAVAVGGVKVNLFKRSFLKLPAFFFVVNLSILIAWFRYLKGERMVSWKPSER